MMRFWSIYILALLLTLSSGISAAAANIYGVERYYEPLDKLASNATLLSRNKEAPTSNNDLFPFSANEYANRMSRIQGANWDAATSAHLKKLTGLYEERMYDAVGIYAELHVKISEEFKKKQVPAQYQILAPMLSGMNVHYASADGKRGIWQLDIITATRYGLVVSDTRDDRDDPILSTRAAASYIKDLQSQFRNQQDVIWAFVGSPALVKRAYLRAESTAGTNVVDYFPEYLQQAVPVFSAWSFIWTYIEKDNLPVFMPAIFLPYENVITAGKTHLGQVSEMLDIPITSLKELNPTLKKQYVDNKETIHLPQGYAERFLSLALNISNYKDSVYFRSEVIQRPSTPTYATGTPSSGSYKSPGAINTTVKKYHKVKPGETLSQLGQKYNVSVSSLKKWNNLKSSGIYAGQKIMVNVSIQNQVSEKEDKTVRENVQIEGGNINDANDGAVNSTQAPEVITPAPKPDTEKPITIVKPKTSAWIYYSVRSGDTLSSIGRKYGVPYAKIKEWNGLRSDNLSVGQKLKIKKS